MKAGASKFFSAVFDSHCNNGWFRVSRSLFANRESPPPAPQFPPAWRRGGAQQQPPTWGGRGGGLQDGVCEFPSEPRWTVVIRSVNRCKFTREPWWTVDLLKEILMSRTDLDYPYQMDNFFDTMGSVTRSELVYFEMIGIENLPENKKLNTWNNKI